ncbi:hypothetical protein EKH55_1488 [Sinorhizobium alkalisoli]|nr:hypothetical protein EKH55_1488 [Sinorhizobium alkalisoli]
MPDGHGGCSGSASQTSQTVAPDVASARSALFDHAAPQRRPIAQK